MYPEALGHLWQRTSFKTKTTREAFKVQGILTGGLLHLPALMHWQGDNEFFGLARRIWTRRCLDRLRQWFHSPADQNLPVSADAEMDDEGEDPAGDETGEVGGHESSMSAPEAGDEETAGATGEVASELGILSEIFTPPQQQVFHKQALIAAIRALACASEQLATHPACREVVEATLCYLKVKVAQGHPVWVTSCQGEITAMPLEVVESIAATDIELLVEAADLSSFDPGGHEWRQFLLHVLFDAPSQAAQVEAARTWLEKHGGHDTKAWRTRYR